MGDTVPMAHSDQQPYREFLERLAGFSTVLAVKLYRVQIEPALTIPVLPCLDHEAMLHEEVSPHAAAYLQDADGHLHEVVVVPDEHRLIIDTTSTFGERTPGALDHLVARVGQLFPGHDVHVAKPSWLKNEQRVAKACRGQVSLRDVLTGPDLEATAAAVDRLQTISVLMEKQSRVASWATRTVTAPLLGLAGFMSYQLLASVVLPAGYAWIASLRYVLIGILGAYFLYYGLKAVQLTEMANRVWKRSAEYKLILAERRRLLALEHQAAAGSRAGGMPMRKGAS